MKFPRTNRILSVCAGGIAGCDRPQSTLNPAGKEAAQILELFWWMTGGAVVVWLIMIALALYAIWLQPGAHDVKQTRRWIIGGGVVFPTVVLSVLLVFGLRMLPPLVAKAPEGSLQVEVKGLQWWWRVRYPPAADAIGNTVELANEIRLPVNEPVQFLLDSEDVLHSFWIPALGGKVDMFPGRRTRLALTPTRTGTFRGVCAEYCGDAHAQMNFDVIVMERADFDAWLREQSRPATTPIDETANRGSELFVSRGCAACHTVRGTEANGTVGPNLTHVGSRASIGAGILKNQPDMFHRWLEETDVVKPGVLMPSFHMLPEKERVALAAYLEQLE